MGILTTAVHVWVLKKHLLQFLKSCLWLKSTDVSSGSHSIPQRPLAEGDGQSRWRELLQLKTCTHSSLATHSLDLPTLVSPIMNPSDLVTAIQKAILLSQSLVLLCLGMLWTRNAQHFRTPLFPLDSLFGLFDSHGLQMNACFPLLF